MARRSLKRGRRVERAPVTERDTPSVRVEVNDPELVEEVLELLRGVGCEASRSGWRTVAVRLPYAAEEDPDFVELSFFLRAWQVAHPDRQFRFRLRIPRDPPDAASDFSSERE